MSRADIESLITQLTQLQLRREAILREEQRVTRDLVELVGRTERDHTARAHEAPDVVPPVGHRDEPARLAIGQLGQRVYITNRIRHVPIGRRSSTRDRAGVVTRVVGERIYVITYNHHKTWRIARNLRPLTETEHQNIVNQQ